MNNEIEHAVTVAPTPVSAIVSVIDRAASNPDIDVEKLERMFALQERMLARQAEMDFNDAMRRVQARIMPVVRDAENKQTNSRYAKLEKIDEAIRPIYTFEGFSLSFGTAKSDIEGYRRITCQISHIGGHSRHEHADLPLDNVGAKGNVNKTDTHATGSSLSYGRRYLTALIFNIVFTDEDDDGQRAQKPIATVEELLDYNAEVREQFPSIAAIKEALANEAWDIAAECVAEIRPQSSEPIDCPFDRLWRAPSKGGIWTTKERTQMGCPEFLAAMKARSE